MTVQAGLCRTWSETTLLVFPRGGSFIFRSNCCIIPSKIIINEHENSCYLKYHPCNYKLVKTLLTTKLYEPRRKKTGLWGFRPGLTQTDLYSHRSRLVAWNIWFKKKRNCSIPVAKTKVLISCVVTAQLICAKAKFQFSHDAAHIMLFF